MSLRSRFALAFAAVGAVVATVVGVLSYQAASDRVLAEIDRSLRSATVALARAQEQDQERALDDAITGAPDLFPGPDRPGPGDEEERQPILQAVSRDGRPTQLGGPPVHLPVSDSTRALAASGEAGQSDTAEIVVDGRTYRRLATALGGDRGALQVAVQVDQTHHVLGGMAREIALVSGAVMLVVAGAGRLLAGRITRRLARLTEVPEVPEEVSADGRVVVDGAGLVGGRDEVGRLSASFSRMLPRIVAAREAQERLVHDAAHELRTPLTSLLTNATVLRHATELSPDARDRLLDDVEGETRELGHLVDELVGLALDRGRQEAEEPVELAGVARRAARRGACTGVPAAWSTSTPALPWSAAGLRDSNARWATCRRTPPSSIPTAASPSRCASIGARSPSRTAGRASTPPTSPACSTGSTGPTPPAACPAPDSASPSSATSPRPMAAPCTRGPDPAAGPRSASPWPDRASCRRLRQAADRSRWTRGRFGERSEVARVHRRPGLLKPGFTRRAVETGHGACPADQVAGNRRPTTTPQIGARRRSADVTAAPRLRHDPPDRP
jgi:two-component system sensor histidine kinase MprB